MRVGIYPGSPTSMVSDAAGKPHGLDLRSWRRAGQATWRSPIDYVRFQRVADIVAAIRDGQVDFTVTNATPARANECQLQPARAGNRAWLSRSPRIRPIKAVEDIDRPGVKIGGHQGLDVGTDTADRNSRPRPSFPPKASRPRSRCSAAARSISTPPTSRHCSRCPTRCRAQEAPRRQLGRTSTWRIAIPKGRETAPAPAQRLRAGGAVLRRAGHHPATGGPARRGEGSIRQ